MYLITQLARKFGLSRATLLYYDRIGLLSPSGRSESGYRLYSPADRERLSAICAYRRAGLGIGDIRRLLETSAGSSEEVIKKRLQELGDEIREMLARQHLLAGMLRAGSGAQLPEQVDKETWVEMMRAAGMDEGAMMRWHSEFERRAPQAHHAFLLSLGISEEEARLIRDWSAKSGSSEEEEFSEKG